MVRDRIASLNGLCPCLFVTECLCLCLSRIHGSYLVQRDVTTEIAIVPKRHRFDHAQEVDCAADQDTDVENLVGGHLAKTKKKNRQWTRQLLSIMIVQ